MAKPAGMDAPGYIIRKKLGLRQGTLKRNEVNSPMNPTTAPSPSNDRIPGIWYATAAFTAWGILPLYWKALQQIPAEEILAHRILWLFIFVSVLLTIYGRWNDVKGIFSTGRNVLAVFLGSIHAPEQT